MRDFLKKKLNRWMMAVMLVVMGVGATLGVWMNQKVGTMAASNDNGETPISYEDKVSVIEQVYADRDSDAKLVILEILPAKEMSLFHMLTYDKLVYNRLSSQSTLATMYDQYNATNNVYTVAGTIAYYHPFRIIKHDNGTYEAVYTNFYLDEILDAATYPEIYDYFTERNADGSYKHLEVRSYIPGELEELYQKGTAYLDEVLNGVSLVYISDRLQNTEIAKFNAFMEGKYTDEMYAKNTSFDSANILSNTYIKNGNNFEAIQYNKLNEAKYTYYYKTEKKTIGKTDYSNAYFDASSFTDAVLVKKNETKTITFVNYSDGQQNWNNFMVMLQNSGLGTSPLINKVTVARADYFGWVGTNDSAHNFNNQGVTTYYSGNKSSFLNDINGATVTVTITNNNNTTAEIYFDIVTKNGTKIQEAYSNIPIDGEFNYWISCEKSYLETEEYRSCDFSWDCAEHILQYIYAGSGYTKITNAADELEDAPVSVIFNWGGQEKDTNMFRFIDFLCTTTNETNSKIPYTAYDKNGNGYTAYCNSYFETVLSDNVNRVKNTKIGTANVKEYYRNSQNLLTSAFVFNGKTDSTWGDTGIPFLRMTWSCSGEYAYNYVFKNSNANDSLQIMGSPYQSSWVSNNSGGTATGRIELDNNGSYLVSSVVSYFLGAEVKDKKVVRVLEIEPCQDYSYDYSRAKTDNEKNAIFGNIRELAISLHMKDYYHITFGAGETNPLSYDYFIKNGGDTRFSFTCVTTADFNGMNDDLISTFDIIIVGSNTGLMNVASDKKTQYNDTSLNGYVYLAYGDLIKVDSTLLGLNPNDYVFAGKTVSSPLVEHDTVTDLSLGYGNSRTWVFNASNTDVWPLGLRPWLSGKEGFYVVRNVKNYYEFVKNYSTSEQYYSDSVGNARFSDNDITQKKQAELLSYAKAGGALLMADDVYNTSVIYPTANLAKLIKTVKSDSKCTAIVRKSDMVTQMLRTIRRTTFGIEGFGVYADANHTIEVPSIGYDGNSLIDVDKKSTAHTLYYELDLKTRAGYTYSIEFLIDQNADGMFDHTIAEDVPIELFYKTTKVKNGKNDITIKLPNDYNGMFYWRIQVDEYKNGVLTDRDIVEASNVVVGDEKHIKVLQILPNDPSVATSTATKTGETWAPSANINLNMAESADFQYLLTTSAKEINYDIQIDTITARDFEEKFEAFADAEIPYVQGTSYNTPSDYLMSNGYSMIVLGFADVYGGDDISDEYGAASCIADFIDNGNSVLFTHDTIGYTTNPNHGLVYKTSDNTIEISGNNTWTADLSRIIRERVGVDRYDVTLDASGNEYVPTKSDGTKITEISGWTDFNLYYKSVMAAPTGSTGSYDGVRSLTNGTLYTEAKGYTYGKTNNAENYLGLKTTKQVTQINQGQITMYPYQVSEVGETINVANTHAQYVQVDLEDKDVVVWYTLSSDTEGDYYGDDTKDAGNNYYIFSKGNVTYSGAGHSSLEVASGKAYSDPAYDELKLFVNTVIRAATAGTYANNITVTNGSASTSTYTIMDENGKELENKTDSFVVYCTDLNDNIEVDFMALNQGLTNKAVLEQVISDKSKIPGLLSRYRSCEIYYLEQVNGATLRMSGKFAEYDKSVSTVDNEGFYRSAYLNGEERTFVIYDPSKETRELDIPAANQQAYIDMMSQCYQEAKNSYSFLYIVAKDANGTTDTTVVKIVSRKLSDLD